MLHPDLPRRDDRIEDVAVERPGHRLVVPDGPHPPPRLERRIRRPQRRGEPLRPDHVPRPHRDGPPGRRQGQQMDVVIVEPRKQRPAPRLEHLIAWRVDRSRSSGGHVDDPVGLDTHVDDTSFDLCSPDDERCSHLSHPPTAAAGSRAGRCAFGARSSPYFLQNPFHGFRQIVRDEFRLPRPLFRAPSQFAFAKTSAHKDASRPGTMREFDVTVSVTYNK